MKALILIALLCASAVSAEPIKIRVLQIDGPNAMSEAQVSGLMRVVSQELHRIGINAMISEVAIVPDPAPETATLEAKSQRFASLFKIYGLASNEYTIVIDRPLTFGGAYYLSGAAKTICAAKGRRFAVSNAEVFNSDREPRSVVSATAAIHELMHLFGARHQSRTCNVMHPDALRCQIAAGNKPLATLATTRREIKACLGL